MSTRTFTNYTGSEVIKFDESGSRSWNDHYSPDQAAPAVIDSLFDDPVLAEDDE